MNASFHPDRVPGAEDAVIEDAKLLDYALNPDHPQGGAKARFFESIGYVRADYEDLRVVILEALPSVQGAFSRTNPDGADNWEAIIAIPRRDNDETAAIATYWEVREGHATRLITVYPA